MTGLKMYITTDCGCRMQLVVERGIQGAVLVFDAEHPGCDEHKDAIAEMKSRRRHHPNCDGHCGDERQPLAIAPVVGIDLRPRNIEEGETE